MSAVLWILSVLGAAFLTAWLKPWAEQVATWRLGGLMPAPRAPFRGIWYSEYHYSLDGETRVEPHLFEVRQFGSTLRGETIDQTGHQSVLKLRAKGRYLTGTWEHKGRGDAMHGALQFYNPPHKDELIGRWVGFARSEGGRIRVGEWRMEQWSTTCADDERQRCLRRFLERQEVYEPRTQGA